VNGRGWTTAIAALTISAAFLGCGGGNGDGGDGKASARTASTETAPSRPGPDLARAVYPKCSFPRFKKPEVSRLVGPTASGLAWQVNYLRLPTAARTPDDTKTVLIVEESPRIKATGVQGGRMTTLAGRRVSLRPPTPTSVVYAVQWNTKQARYFVLADAKTSTVLERFIACLP
jgi:hypothetical protein